MKVGRFLLFFVCLFGISINFRAEGQPYQQTPYQRVAWSHDGKSIAVVSATGVRLFDAETLERVLLPDVTAVNVAFSPDDRLLALTDDTGQILLRDITASELVTSLAANADQVIFSPDGTHLLSTGYQEVKLWEVATGTLIHRLEFPPCPADHCGAVQAAFSPDGQSVVTLGVSLEGRPESVWQQWDVNTWDKIQEFVPESVYIPTPIFFSPDGKTVIVGDGIWVWIWALETNTLRQAEQVDLINDDVYDLGHQWGITTIAYSADGSRFASAGYDGTIQIYDSASEKEITYMTAEGGIYGLALSPDGGLAATVNEDGVFQIWDATTGELLHTHKTDL